MKKVVIKIILLVFCTLIIFSSYLIVVEKNKLLKYDNLVASECSKYNINKNLVLAIIKTESNFNENIVSKKNAKGLMQLLDETASYIANLYQIEYSGNLFDAKTNITLGVAYLDYLYKKFNRTDIVLASYNAGEGRVKKWIDSGIITDKKIISLPYKETQNYIKLVTFRQKIYDKFNKNNY